MDCSRFTFFFTDIHSPKENAIYTISLHHHQEGCYFCLLANCRLLNGSLRSLVHSPFGPQRMIPSNDQCFHLYFKMDPRGSQKTFCVYEPEIILSLSLWHHQQSDFSGVLVKDIWYLHILLMMNCNDFGVP